MLTRIRCRLSTRTYGRPLSLALALALLMVVLPGCNFLPDEEAALAPPLVIPAEITYKTITLEPTTIVNSFRGSGSVVSQRLESVMFTETSGRLDQIAVEYGDTVEAGDLLASLNVEDLDDQIETGELEHRKAEISYIQTQERYNAGQITAYDLERASIDFKLSQIRLNRLIEQKELADLYSPISGRVVFAADMEHNDYVEAYKKLVTVADMSNLLIRYSGEDYASLVPGSEVNLLVGRVLYDGVVIASGIDAPDDTDDSISESALIQTLEPLAEGIRLGFSAYFEYELERSEDAIVIPKRLLNTVAGRKYVNVLVDGLRVEMDVQTGIQNDTEIEIVSGLAAGDQIIDR